MNSLKRANQTGYFNPQKKRRNLNNDSFLEAFKSIGTGLSDSLKEDVVKGTARSFADQLFNRQGTNNKSGVLSADQSVDFGKILEKERKQTENVVRSFYERTRSTEKLVFSQKEEEVKLKIKALREEVKSLIKATVNVAKEVEKVALEEVISPGDYHVSFFEKIKSYLILARKNIEQSKTWLSLWQSRSKKRNYYWGQFKKSGTKFLLSQERYMSTQMG